MNTPQGTSPPRALVRLSAGSLAGRWHNYSPAPDHAAETEYTFMGFVEGALLSDTWFDVEERDIISITHQVTELESNMMSVAFPAGGSLYYASDLVFGSL